MGVILEGKLTEESVKDTTGAVLGAQCVVQEVEPLNSPVPVVR